jgi:hypothetical protein
MMTSMLSRVLALVAVCSALAACTTAYDTVDLDGTTKGYRIYCNGLPYSSTGDCASRARTICGDDGFVILKENDPHYVHNQMFWDATTHSILAKCNTPVNPPAASYPQE